MARSEKRLVHKDFAAKDDVELDALMLAFKRLHEVETGERLAIDAKRSLGPGKVRVSFRVVAGAARR